MSDASVIDADLVVIGFGKGGKTLAATLGRQGWRVVMVERSPMMYGGTCINIGCVPTKSMVYRSEHLDPRSPHTARYRDAVDATADLTSDLRAVNLSMLTGIDTVTVLTGQARFRDATTVDVHTTDGADVTVAARYIVVNTGAEPVIPAIPGLKDSPNTVTSTELLSTAELPGRLVVLGGGYVGLEFAAMLRSYGSEVTVLERHARILGNEDDDIADNAAAILRAAGVDVVCPAEVTAVRDESDGSTSVTYRADGEHVVAADTVLVALGRAPVTADLGLEQAGIAVAADGSILVDDALRSSQPHVFAIGDVNGGPQFTYISLDDYRIVLSQLTGDSTRTTASRSAVPYALFTTPPLARVGLTERGAREAGLPVKVAAMPVAKMATMPRARIVDETAGMMKVVVHADTDEILGAALLSYDSHEVINLVALAMRHHITASQLRDEIYTHPSMTEGFNQLLGSITSPARPADHDSSAAAPR